MGTRPDSLTNRRSDPARSAALKAQSRITGLLPVTIYDIECGICEKPFVPPRGTDHVLCRACRRSGARQL
jgi:hypothetical protein